MSYFDLDRILAEDERIQCEFMTDAVDCGYLDMSCESEDVVAGHKMELPLWLAEKLAGHIKPHLPLYLNHRARQQLRAGPASVNLRERNIYFYTVGQILLGLLTDPREITELQSLLQFVFGGDRYRRILDQAMNSQQTDTTEFTRQLTQLERQLFDIGHTAAQDNFAWKGQQSLRLQTASVLKRQRIN